ncbi:MAG: deoxynucleoside kinase, partial [Gammaproteobacteria bacterium]
MDADYLQRLSETYVRFFYHYKKAPLLIINTTEVNFAEGEEDFAMLLSQIGELPRGVTYFNQMTNQT